MLTRSPVPPGARLRRRINSCRRGSEAKCSELASSSVDRVEWWAGSFPHWCQGTAVRWELGDNPDGDGTRVVMTHAGFDPDNPVVGIVTMGWGEILAHLRGFAEDGRPQPYFTN